jgi:RNA polymerase sigma-70 factor (ECF subfamily)
MTQKDQSETVSTSCPGGLEPVFPFLSHVFSSQSTVPELVEAERELLRAIAASEGALDPDVRIRLTHAAIRAQAEPRSGSFGLAAFGSALDPFLETFATKLSSCSPFLSLDGIKGLRESGLGSAALIEAACAVGMAQFLLTLARSSGSELGWRLDAPSWQSKPPNYFPEGFDENPLLEMPTVEPEELKRSNSILREQYGFLPNLFAIQSHCPEIVKTQVKVLDTLVFGEDHLSRVQKELIVLRLAALNINTYLVTMQVNIVGLLGIGAEECDQIIDTGQCACLSQAEHILLEEIGKLSLFSNTGRTPFNWSRLREQGFTDPQIIEGVATAALTNFFWIVQFGLNPASDFPPHRTFTRKDLYPSDTDLRPTSDVSLFDPDAGLVAQVKEGNTEFFAELVRRHTRRVFGTLAGMLGNVDDARDSTQDVFLKAFQNIGNFQGRSKFSTWIMSIAVNTGTELLRHRRPTESLDDREEELSFRPRQIRSWVEDPEQQLAKAQINDLVRQGVLRLPEKYRIALLLRDINQIPTEEAAAALNLSVPALKARVLRGRLMLRESLTPHFSRSGGESDV